MSDKVTDIKPEEEKKTPPKPELAPAEAQWLVQKLDVNLPLEGHQERNILAAIVNKLLQIANHKEDQDGT